MKALSSHQCFTQVIFSSTPGLVSAWPIANTNPRLTLFKYVDTTMRITVQIRCRLYLKSVSFTNVGIIMRTF